VSTHADSHLEKYVTVFMKLSTKRWTAKIIDTRT
jgi:hypothetical protein